MSVCLSVRMEHLGSHRTDFLEISYLSIFRISLEKFQVPLISAQNNGTLPEAKPVYICDSILLNST